MSEITKIPDGVLFTLIRKGRHWSLPFTSPAFSNLVACHQWLTYHFPSVCTGADECVVRLTTTPPSSPHTSITFARYAITYRDGTRRPSIARITPQGRKATIGGGLVDILNDHFLNGPSPLHSPLTLYVEVLPP